MRSLFDTLGGAKKIYFVGIGGISMSALAIYFSEKGYTVSGCDDNRLANYSFLESRGIEVNSEKGLNDSDIAIVSSAIPKSHSVIVRIKSLDIPIMKRGELLGILAGSYPICIGVCGTHGKTTCTSMIAHILKAAGKKFTAHIGGFDKDFGNMYIGGDEIFLSEVCEYKKNISYFSPDIGVVLNVGDDHIESYGSSNALKSEFENFASRSKVAVLNGDDKFLKGIDGVKFSTYDNNCEYYASDIKLNDNVLEYSVNRYIDGLFDKLHEYRANCQITAGSDNEKRDNRLIDRLFDIEVKTFFKHDIYNSMAAIVCALQLGIEEKYIIEGLKNFKGIKRRGEIMGKVNNSLFFADYAHHPDEVKNTVSAACEKNVKTAFLFQSHTYSRTSRLLKEFAKSFDGAENIYIFDTYGARETYDERGSGKNLCLNIDNAVYCGEVKNCESLLIRLTKNFDLIMILGAGDLYFYVEKFIEDFGGKSQ